MNRRMFLKGLVATAAGVLVAGDVAAEPMRRVWALDSTHLQPEPMFRAEDRIDHDYVANIVGCEQWEGRRYFITLDGIRYPVADESFPTYFMLVENDEMAIGPRDDFARAYLAEKHRPEEIMYYDNNGILMHNDGTGPWKPVGDLAQPELS